MILFYWILGSEEKKGEGGEEEEEGKRALSLNIKSY